MPLKRYRSQPCTTSRSRLLRFGLIVGSQGSLSISRWSAQRGTMLTSRFLIPICKFSLMGRWIIIAYYIILWYLCVSMNIGIWLDLLFFPWHICDWSPCLSVKLGTYILYLAHDERMNPIGSGSKSRMLGCTGSVHLCFAIALSSFGLLLFHNCRECSCTYKYYRPTQQIFIILLYLWNKNVFNECTITREWEWVRLIFQL